VKLISENRQSCKAPQKLDLLSPLMPNLSQDPHQNIKASKCFDANLTSKLYSLAK